MYVGSKITIYGGGPLAGEIFTGKCVVVTPHLVSVNFDEAICFPNLKLYRGGSFSRQTGFFVFEGMESDILSIKVLP